MERITEKMLQRQVDYLNQITNNPATPYGEVGQGANIGNYHISHAYGGVCLHQMSNKGGGVRCPLSQGHIPKRDLYNELAAYIKGIEVCTKYPDQAHG